MEYIEQEILVGTNTAYGAEVPLSISSGLFLRLNETARPCVRMALEGSSASVGALPQWLERASDIRTLRFEKSNGHSVLHLKAPRLGDAAPDMFDQQRLWPGIARADDTAIQIIGRVAQVVRRHEESSDVFDQPLLKHFTNWKSFFKRDVHSVQLAPANDSSGPFTLDMAVAVNAKELSDQTPAPRQVRIVGKLDMVRHSTRSFGLILAGGAEVRGVLVEGDHSILQEHFGKEITVLGRAVYRPSGSLLRIDAQELLESTEGRSIFSQIPEPLQRASDREHRLVPARRGVAAFFGTWPGEETDGELLEMLGELRK